MTINVLTKPGLSLAEIEEKLKELKENIQIAKALVVAGKLTAQGELEQQGISSYEIESLAEFIASPQNNLEIKKTLIRLTANKAIIVTGLKPVKSGRLVIIGNASAFNIEFENEGVGSEEANRIHTSHGIQLGLQPGRTITFVYDGITKRWRNITIGEIEENELANSIQRKLLGESAPKAILEETGAEKTINVSLTNNAFVVISAKVKGGAEVAYNIESHEKVVTKFRRAATGVAEECDVGTVYVAKNTKLKFVKVVGEVEKFFISIQEMN